MLDANFLIPSLLQGGLLGNSSQAGRYKMATHLRQKASPTRSDGDTTWLPSAVSGFRVVRPAPLFSSHSCPFPLRTDLLAPLVLAAVLQPTAGAPLDAPTDSPAGETSGEEAETASPDDALAVALESVLGATKLHKNEVRPSPLGELIGSFSKLLLITVLFLYQFLAEFQGEVKYDFLGHYKIPSLPAKCPYSNFGKVGSSVIKERGPGWVSVLDT